MSSPLSLEEFQRPILEAPEGHRKVLLHSCCAPCSGEVIEALRASALELTVYFYNPNIHPREEYELRKAENIRFAQKHAIPFVDADYD
jgi:predicted adenine nucleotide alpha hydrolase (AANH) superfamily ATPase